MGTERRESARGTQGGLMPYVFGGAGGMIAQSVVQPVDMIKVRMQLHGEGVRAKRVNPMSIVAQMVRTEGVGSLYRGLSCGLFRQGTYTTARMGLFNEFCAAFESYNKRSSNDIGGGSNSGGYSATFGQKALASLVAGGIGAVIGTPPDVAAVRMQADGLLPKERRSGYTNVFNALYKIVHKEGFLYLWRGATPSITRAMALNLGMLATYSHAKEVLEPSIPNRIQLEVVSSALSGFCAAALSLPFDFVKTRIQRQRPDLALSTAEGVHMKPYTGVVDCAVRVARTEGLLAFYKGFPVYYLRIAPHAMLTLLISTTLTSLFT